MRHYTYKCWDCDVELHLVLTAHDQKMPPREAVCPICWSLVEQDYTKKGVQTDILEAYVERDFTSYPIEVTSRSQRDALCDKHRATYDTGRYVRPSTRTPWEKGLTWEKVKHIASQRETLDG